MTYALSPNLGYSRGASDGSARMQHIFISYARKDGLSHAELLDKALRERGFSTWRDTRGIDPTRDFTSAIERAIEGANWVVVCVTAESKREDGFVRREIQYALLEGKPVIPLRFENITPHVHIVDHTWINFHEDWTNAFEELCRIVSNPPEAYQRRGVIVPASSMDIFRPYLRRLYQQVVRFLSQAVEHEIKLKSQDTPAAVDTPADVMAAYYSAYGLEAPAENFSSFEEAVEHYDGRLLLLGEPGAGKTITLMAHLRAAIAARLNNMHKPLPLLGLIPTWDADKQPSLAEWLAATSPNLRMKDVSVALEAGSTLLLLDGLDELGSEREDPITHEKYDPRVRFLQQLPENNRVIMSSRVRDYIEIRLLAKLNGAITLKPLDEEQIREFLAHQPDLLAVIDHDAALGKMLRTPLLLNLFSQAYKNHGKEARKLTGKSGEFHDEIIGRYVRERYNFEARRQHVSVPFTLKETYRILGQIAIDGIASTQSDDNEFHIKDFGRILQKDARAFIEMSRRLNILVGGESGTLRFIHILMRDHFAILRALEAARAKHPDMRSRAALALGVLGDPRGIQPLIALLSDVEPDVRMDAARALVRIGETAVPALIDSLKHQSVDVRIAGARILGRIGSPAAVAPLITLVRDPEFSVQKAAAWGLEKIGGPAVPDLINLMKGGEAGVRRLAINAVGYIQDVRAVEPLVLMLYDVVSPVRESAAEALGHIGDLTAVEPLITALDDEDPWVRASAARALGRLRDPRAVLRLMDLLFDDSAFGEASEHVCDCAAEALEQIGTPEASAAVGAWHIWTQDSSFREEDDAEL